MTHANIGTLGVVAGRRDELIAMLTAPGGELRDAGCLLYEVGARDDDPDTVYVVELWESEAAHAASLRLPAVQAAVLAARPLLSGVTGGFAFEVVGSPLRG